MGRASACTNKRQTTNNFEQRQTIACSLFVLLGASEFSEHHRGEASRVRLFSNFSVLAEAPQQNKNKVVFFLS